MVTKLIKLCFVKLITDVLDKHMPKLPNANVTVLKLEAKPTDMYRNEVLHTVQILRILYTQCEYKE